MTTCLGKTKTGTNCTKKIKSTETYCYLHKDQSKQIIIQPEITNYSFTEINQEIPDIDDETGPQVILKSRETFTFNTKLTLNDQELTPEIWSRYCRPINVTSELNKYLSTNKQKFLPDDNLTDINIINKIKQIDTLKIWTFNINSVRKKIDIVDNLLLKYDIDILLLTETKIQPKLESELKFHPNYKIIWNSNKNSYYHGVAFVYKNTLDIELLSNFLPSYSITEYDGTDNINIINKYKDNIPIEIEKAHYNEGRILVIKCNYNKKDIIIVGTYVPNSGCNKKERLKRLSYRTLSWDPDIYRYLIELQNKYENVILIGDLNVTIMDNDLKDVNANIAGTTKNERKNMNKFLTDHKWIDTWHNLNSEIIEYKKRATWGINTYCPMRLDYIICTPSLKDNLVSSFIDQTYEGSDHVPIGLNII